MSFYKDIKNFLLGKKENERSDNISPEDPLGYFKKSAEKTGQDILEKAKAGVEKIADQAERSSDKLVEKYKEWQRDISRRSSRFEEEISDQYKDATENAEERLERLRKRAEELRSELADKPDPAEESRIYEEIKDMENAKNKIEEDLKEEADKIRTKAEKMGAAMEDEIKDEKERFQSRSRRFKDTAEEMGDSFVSGMTVLLKKLQVQAGDLTDQLEVKGEEIRKKAHAFLHEKDESGKSLMDEAKETFGKIKSSWTDTMNKAQEEAEKEADSSPYHSSPQDRENLRKSEMDDKDEFWRKAEAFAAGDYDRVSPVKIEKTEPEEKPSGSVKGFTDEDGDRDEWIDDATIVGEEE